MAEVRTLTLDDIYSNDALRSGGYSPGDTYTMGSDGSATVTRVHSEEGSEIDLGVSMTQEIIDAQSEEIKAEMEEQGVVVGDRYIPSENRFIDTGKNSMWKQLDYGFSEEAGMLQNINDTLEARLDEQDDGWFSWFDPTAGGFDLGVPSSLPKTREERYGKGFEDASVEQRTAMIKSAADRKRLDKFGRRFEPNPDSTARTVGRAGSAILDPTSAFPVGRALKTAIPLGAALGGLYSATSDTAEGVPIDPKRAAITAGFAGTGVGALGLAGKGISKTISSSAMRRANRVVDSAEETIAQRIKDAGGLEAPDIIRVPSARQAAELSDALKLTGRTPYVPRTPEQAAERVLHRMIDDPVIARYKYKAFDEYLGSLSTRLEKISPAIKRAMRQMEFNTLTRTRIDLDAVDPFIKSMNEMKKQRPVYDAMTKAMYNQDFNKAAAYMSVPMQRQFKDVQKVLKELGKDLNEHGVSTGMLPEYFPRMIKDHDELIAHLDKTLLRDPKNKTQLQELWADEAARLKINVNQLSHTRKSELTSAFLRGYTKDTINKAGGGFQKPRVIKQIGEDLLPFYRSPGQSLQMYISNAANSIERGRFLGQGVNKKTNFLNPARVTNALEDGADGITRSVNDSIGDIVADQKIVGILSRDQETALRSMLEARLIGGERSASKWNSTLRDLGYMATIANPLSALVQLGDVFVSGALNSFKPTIHAMFGHKNVKLLDVGINKIAQEIQNDVRPTARALDKMFSMTGFKAIDRLGKETSMNAALKKNFKLLSEVSKDGKMTKGEKQFREKWQKFYREDTDDLIASLRSGKVDEAVKFHAFNELSDIQPITLMEMPEKYLTMPNGRILYSLKTFTLKQWDIVRREVIQEAMKPGAASKVRAASKAALLAAYLSAGNVGTQTIRDLLSGRDVGVESIPDRSLWALLGVYGFNKYSSEKYLSKGKFTDFFTEQVRPVVPLVDAIFEGATQGLFEEDPNWGLQLRAIPGMGSMLYNWFGGGAENYNKRLAKEPLIFNPSTKAFFQDADAGPKFNPAMELLFNQRNR